MKNIVVIVVLILSLNLKAQHVITDYYHPTGPSENLIAMFDHSIEATTTSKYNGLVGVKISGIGFDKNSTVNLYDAFYEFINPQAGWIPKTSSSTHRIAFDGNTSLGPNDYFIGDNTTYESSTSLYNIVWNNSVGKYDGMNIGGIPEYRSDHSYSYVLQLNTLPRVINFGFGNASGIEDVINNCGHYQISVTPLASGAVPETTSTIATGLVLCSYIFIRRKNFRI